MSYLVELVEISESLNRVYIIMKCLTIDSDKVAKYALQ